MRSGPVPGSTGDPAVASRRPRDREAAISADKSASWVYSEDFLPADDVLLRATDAADQLGAPAVSPGSGAVLRVVAAALRATAVVEVGTGTGVAGLWLLQGMAPDGVLTTIDTEAEHQRAAREAFTAAGVRPNRVRTITGRALDVLPRLTDGGYDLVLVDGTARDCVAHVTEAVRLLRRGGLLAVGHALNDDRLPDPARRDETTTRLRELLRAVRDDERLVPAMLPVGDGLLLAARAED